jgi:phage recombination protein Bet
MNSTSTAVAIRRPRLPMPTGLSSEIDERKWRVLTDAIFPNARTPEAIVLAIDYCRSRNLDIMKRPVNIVSIWNSALGREVESVWPSINETQVTAARTREWAGMDRPEWGPDQPVTFRGRRKVKENNRESWQDVAVDLVVPTFCAVTVYRIIGGQRCAFTEPVYWLEAYGRIGRSELPNDMWAKRPRGQLLKVSKAASLRAAFPEENSDYTAEEMEGVTIGVDAPPVAPDEADAAPPQTNTWSPPLTVPPPVDPETGEFGPHEIARTITDGEPEDWRNWGQRFIAGVEAATVLADIDQWEDKNKAQIERMRADAPKVATRLVAAINRQRIKIAEIDAAPPPEPPPGQPEA